MCAAWFRSSTNVAGTVCALSQKHSGEKMTLMSCSYSCLFICSTLEHIVARVFFLMPVAQRLPLDPVHPFESSEGEQGHYANALNAGKRGDAELMHQKKKHMKAGHEKCTQEES